MQSQAKYEEHEEQAAENVKKPKRFRKGLLIAGAVVLVIGAILFAVLYPTEFERVENKAVQIAGMASSGKGYFELDTYPDVYDDMDPEIVAVMQWSTQENTLDAIRYANEALGFNGSVYSQMLETTAMMGRQTETNDKYKVSWTYHPDDGLEVTYEKK